MVKVQVNEHEYYMDGYLQENLDTAKNIIRKDWDMILLVDGNEGCLSGDTIINTNRYTLGRKRTLKRLYNAFHNNILGLKNFKPWNLEEPTYIRSFDGKQIRLNRIINVMYSGKKETHKIRLENNTIIKATAEHKFMTNKGWERLENLKIGDELMCDNLYAQKSGRKRIKLKDVALKVDYHPYKNVRSEVEVHRLIYEAYINKLEFLEYLDILLNEKEKSKTLFFVDPNTYHIHHKDGNHYNNSIDNLEKLPKEEHKKFHGEYNNFSQGNPVFLKITGIATNCIEDVYDIEVEQPNNNFVANGIVVHNSGKSVMAQQMAKYVDPSFCIERIVFTPSEFRKAIVNAEKYTAVIYDEAYTGLSSRATMSLINRTLISMLAEIRQKNLFVFVVMPCFFDLDKYVALWRSRVLIHVYTDGFKRGYFCFYNVDKKKELYMLGKKYYAYSKPKCNFYGRFTDYYVIDETAYRLKKRNSSLEREKKSAELEKNKEVQDLLFSKLQDIKTMDHPLRMNILGMTHGAYFYKLKAYEDGKLEDTI